MTQMYKTIITVTTVNEDGSPVDGPSNTLTDCTNNLTEAQAKASHYAAKAILGGVYQRILDEILTGGDEPEVIRAANV